MKDPHSAFVRFGPWDLYNSNLGVKYSICYDMIFYSDDDDDDILVMLCQNTSNKSYEVFFK